LTEQLQNESKSVLDSSNKEFVKQLADAVFAEKEEDRIKAELLQIDQQIESNQLKLQKSAMKPAPLPAPVADT